MPKYSKRGVPDIVCVKEGKYVGIEVKTEKGALSEHRHDFGRGLMLAGGDYFVVRSVDDVINLRL